MISLKNFKAVMKLKKIIPIYVLAGMLMAILAFIFTDDSKTAEIVMMITSIIYVLGFFIIGLILLHYEHKCGCPFCGAGTHLIRDDKYDAAFKAMKKQGYIICPRCGCKITVGPEDKA